MQSNENGTRALAFLRCTASMFVLSFMAMGGNFALADDIVLPETTTTTSPIELPPPPRGAWEDSAQANILMEEGGFAPRGRSPWGASYFNWSNVNMEDASVGGGRLNTYNYVSFDYRINWESRISLRPEFYVSGPGKDFIGRDVKGESEMGEIYLQYFRSRMALIGDRIGLSGAFRIYYPNSENSKTQRLITKIQSRLIFEMPLGHGVWVSYHFRPTYFFQSEKTYISEFFQTKQTEHYRLEQLLEISKIFNGWAIHQGVGLEDRQYYGSAANDLEAKVDGYLSFTTAASVNISGLSLKGGLNYETKIADPRRSRQAYAPADTNYFLMSYVRF